MDNLRNNFDSVPQFEDENKVHHLYLNASQIAPGCILTSNLERTKVIADTFDKAEYLGQHREYITYTGEKHGVPMSVMSCGNGCMPMEIAVEELRHINCRKMIKVGTCSAILPDIKPGTLIVPTGACRCEGATLEYLNLQYPAVADLDAFFALKESAKEIAKEIGAEVLTGIVRTHDALFLESRFAHDGVAERIRPWQELGVLATDNEVATMYTVGSILQMQTGAVLVAVDNLATGEAIDFDVEYDKLIATAIEIGTRALAKLIRG